MRIFEIKNKFEDADFWLINRANNDELGLPIKEYRDCLTGIKCNQKLILPTYAYYLFLHLYQQGIWKQYGISTINFQHLRITDIRKVANSIFIKN